MTDTDTMPETDTRYIPAAQPLAHRAPFTLAAGELAPEPDFVGCPKLTDALAQARDRCRVADRDAQVAHEKAKYKYTSANSIKEAANEAMRGSGLALLPVEQSLDVIGAGGHALYVLNRLFILSHSSGEFTTIKLRGLPVIPGNGRPLDKAYLAALTTSQAYALAALLQIENALADDIASREEKRPAKAPNEETPLNDQEYTALLRQYYKRAEECEQIEPCLRKVYDDVHGDGRVHVADRKSVKQFIAECKRKLIAAAPKPAAENGARAPGYSNESIPF